MMSDLPSLVFGEIFGFLTFKQRAKCKQVCRAWRDEIESRDAGKSALVFHTSFFPLNRKWGMADKRLMKIENSIQIASFESLRAPALRSHFKHLKRVQLLNNYALLLENRFAKFDGYIDWLVECEELEVQGFEFGDETTFSLPRLRTLALKKIECDQLTVDCPSLEVLIIWAINLKRADYKSTDRLKYLEVSTHTALNFKPGTEFQRLECLNVNDRAYFLHQERDRRRELIRCMPGLKKLVCYSNCIRRKFLTEIANWRKEQNGPNDDLQILVSGFESTGEIIYSGNSDSTVMLSEEYVEPLFENYTRLVESDCAWDVLIDYNDLFAKFRILPRNFFVSFPDVYLVKITSVPCYNHLFSFLKLCPALDSLEFHKSLSKIKPEFLDLLYLLTPSLRFMIIREDHHPKARIDCMFLRNLKLTFFKFASESKLLLRTQCPAPQ